MCLITFAYHQHPQYALILLANRDEFYARPSQALHFWADAPDLCAGRDLAQQGTWLGLHRDGRLCAVTNYRDGRRRDSDLRSRGHLTRDYLQRGRSAADWLRRERESFAEYGGFNLLLADREEFYYSSNRGGRTGPLSPGVYSLSNALLDTPWPKAARSKALLQHALRHNRLDAAALLEIMQDPREARAEQLPDTGISREWERRLSACFIRLPEYGTRATTLLWQDYRGQTRILEQSYDGAGAMERREFRLQLPVLGGSPPRRHDQKGTTGRISWLRPSSSI